MSVPEKRASLIEAQSATLWHNRDDDTDLLNITFAIPAAAAGRLSKYKDDTAAATAFGNIADKAGVYVRKMEAATGMLSEDAFLTKVASEEQHHIAELQYGSGSEVLIERTIQHLGSIGCPAIKVMNVSASPGKDGIVEICMKIQDAPEKILGLARSLQEAGKLKEEIKLNDIASKAGIAASASPSYHEFLVSLNKNVIGPANNPELIAGS